MYFLLPLRRNKNMPPRAREPSVSEDVGQSKGAYSFPDKNLSDIIATSYRYFSFHANRCNMTGTFRM